MTLSMFSYLPSFPNHFFFSRTRYWKFTWLVFDCDTFSPDWTCWRGCCKARLHREWDKTVADPNGGRGHSDTEIREGAVWKIFSALLASVWSKNKGEGVGRPPRPLSWICHCGNKMTFLIPLLLHGPFLKLLYGIGEGASADDRVTYTIIKSMINI